MKIILTVHQFFPEFTRGTEVIALGIAKELKRRGHELTIVTAFPDWRQLTDADRFDRYSHEGIRVERFRHTGQPMGDQRVRQELAYDNHLFARAFDTLLAELEPDVVHFLHLARLSASIIGSCVARAIPTVFTATDFWPVCPYSQLRRWDNALCAGPDASGVNCLRHTVHRTVQRERLARLALCAPDWMLAAALNVASKGLPLAPSFLTEAGALANRPSFVREQLNTVDRVLAPSRIMERILTEGGIARDRIRVLPYGTDMEQHVRTEDRGVASTCRLGFIGSISEQKGVEVAVKAMGLLGADIPVELNICGTAPKDAASQAYERALRSLAASDPRIRFSGAFANERVSSVLSSMDVLIVPSVWYENTPMVVNEAFASGCPVIASDVEGISEVVHHERDGLLFARGDAAGLAACIRRVAEDRGLLRRLARGTVPPPTVASHVDALETIYADVTRERRAHAHQAFVWGGAPGAGIHDDVVGT